MKFKDLTEKHIELALSIYNNKSIKFDDRIRQIQDIFGISERETRKWIAKLKNDKKAQPVYFDNTTQPVKDDFDRKLLLPKILVLDIETAPLMVFVWQLWKQNIGLSQIISNFFILSWSAKWLFGDTIMSERLTGHEALEQNDSRIIKKIHALLNKTDIIIAHNGNAFDLPKLNSRFILNNLPPTKSYQTIDTLLIARKQFGFDSNKLDALAHQFGIGGKIHTDFELWSRCMKGDDTALEDMEKYNIHDVEILEEVYLKIRPYIKNHPNLNLYMETEAPCCANCGSKNIKEDSYYYTSVSQFIVYRCECGALSRQRVNNLSKEHRQRLMVGVSR